MKMHKTITVDEDVRMYLRKVSNASALINKLIREHFKTGDEECPHDWSNAFSTAGGLVKECRICHVTKDVKA